MARTISRDALEQKISKLETAIVTDAVTCL